MYIYFLKIHTITKSCGSRWGPWVYCNDRIYIQSIDDVVYHDIRYPDVLFYIDLNSNSPAVKLLFDSSSGYAKIPKNTAIKASLIGGTFKVISETEIEKIWNFFLLKIFTHFATTVTFDYQGNFRVYPSKFDSGRIFGILGDYNGVASDDKTRTKCGTVTTEAAFFDCYKWLKSFEEIIFNFIPIMHVE